MNRRNFIARSIAAGLGASNLSRASVTLKDKKAGKPAAKGAKLTPPEKGTIPVAFVISDRVTVIDLTGPWEVFQDAGFDLFTVAQSLDVVNATAGLKIGPNFTFDNAPAPKVVVIPAQVGGETVNKYLHKVFPASDVMMSVCTGAFQLARAGLLSGLDATTHHDFVDRLAKEFPDIHVQRGLRFVENEKISTSGGLTSGVDLALRVVERYFGREVAQRTATYMEYQSTGWII
jgi:transcriptional regulator GlxA family with amidase domain